MRDHEFNKSVGEQVRKFRIREGLSQTELARAVNLTCMAISKIEHGQSGLSLLNAKLISERLRVSIARLIPCEHKNTQFVPHPRCKMEGEVVCIDCGHARDWNAY